MPTQTWNAALYEGKHAYVWQYGEDLLTLLAARPGEQILDLGCGTGQLTAAIAQTGATVLGLDQDAAMVEKAQQNYPSLRFAVADARTFQVDQPYDAVFSNAVLHWVLEPDAAIRSMAAALKSGGRLVAEFGGKGNVEAIVAALSAAVEALTNCPVQPVWYFPSVGEYAARLEQHGFEVRYAQLFDRPTPLDGDQGMTDWIEMFADRLLVGLSSDQRQQVMQTAVAALRPRLYRDGTWIADYRRLRVIACKH